MYRQVVTTLWKLLILLVLASLVITACTPLAPKAQPTQASTPWLPTQSATNAPAPTATRAPTSTPTATPTITPTPGPIQTGEIWFDKNAHIPGIVGSAAMFDPKHPMQADAAKAMVRYWLESPYTQKLLDELVSEHPQSGGIYCAYTKAFATPGKDVSFDARKEIPGGVLFTQSSKGMVSTYINGKFTLKVMPTPSDNVELPTNGWAVRKETVPEYGGRITAVFPVFSLGYMEGYGKQYVDWQQMCEGLPFLVWDPHLGFLKRDMLHNPDIADKLQPGTAVALLETLTYEFERSEAGYGKAREIHYTPVLYGPLASLENSANLDLMNYRLRNNTNGSFPPLNLSYDYEHDKEGALNAAKLSTMRRFFSLIIMEPFPASFTKVNANGQIADSAWYSMRLQAYGAWGKETFSSDNVSKQMLSAKTNLPPYVPSILPESYTDGLYAQADIPAAVTTLAFWWRFLVEQGYHRPDDATFKTGQGTVLDLMFGLHNLPNFRPDQGQAQPYAFNFGDGDLYQGYTDGAYPNQYGTLLSNPDRMAGLLKRFYETIGLDGSNINNQFVANYELAPGPMLPTLFFHIHSDGAVVYGDWKPITAPPGLHYMTNSGGINEAYWNGHDIDANITIFGQVVATMVRTWAQHTSIGNTQRLGGGILFTNHGGRDIGSENVYDPTSVAGGRWHYGGPVFFRLHNLKNGDVRLPFPFKKFGNTYVNPKTGLYELDTDVLTRVFSYDGENAAYRNMNENDPLTDFGNYITCAPYSYLGKDFVPWDSDFGMRIATAHCGVENTGPGLSDDDHTMWFYSDDNLDDILDDKQLLRMKDLPISQGYAQALLQSYVLLMGNSVSNSNALGSINLVDWLTQDQKQLQQAAKDGKAIYNPNAPYFGLYWVPSYHVPVFYFALNPVAGFDATELLLSNDWLTKPGDSKESYPSPLGISYINDQVYRWSRYSRSLGLMGEADFPNIFWHVPAKYLDSCPYIFAPKDIYEDEFFEKLKDSQWLMQTLDETPYYYRPSLKRMLAAIGYTKDNVPLYIVDPKLVLPEKEDEIKNTYNGTAMSFLAIPAFLDDASKNAMLWTSNYLPLGSYRPLDFERKTQSNLKYVYLWDDLPKRMPPAVEMQIIAQENGVCLPWPTAEEGECSLTIKDGADTLVTTSYMEQNFKDLQRVMSQLLPKAQVVDARGPEKLNNICQTSVFYQAQRKFGNDVAQRMWKVAHMLAFNDKDVVKNLPPFHCESNDDYIQSYRLLPWQVPVLYEMLHDGKFGGLSNPPREWKRDPSLVWMDFFDYQKRYLWTHTDDPNLLFVRPWE